MKRLTKEEIAAAQRIFNNTSQLLGGYYPRKTEQEAKGFISQNRWMMFPVLAIDSLREGTEMPVPNVFVSFDQEQGIKDNGNGTPLSADWIGLTFGNAGAMTWFHEVMKKNGDYIINLVRKLSSGWEVCVDHKIKLGYQDATPYYSSEYVIDTGTVGRGEWLAKVQTATSGLPKKGSMFNGYGGEVEEVLWAITTTAIARETDSFYFQDHMKEIFELFTKILSLR